MSCPILKWSLVFLNVAVFLKLLKYTTEGSISAFKQLGGLGFQEYEHCRFTLHLSTALCREKCRKKYFLWAHEAKNGKTREVFSCFEPVALCASTKSFLLQPDQKSLLRFTGDTSLSCLFFFWVRFLNDIFLNFCYALFIWRTSVTAALKLSWIIFFLMTPIFKPFVRSIVDPSPANTTFGNSYIMGCLFSINSIILNLITLNSLPVSF